MTSGVGCRLQPTPFRKELGSLGIKPKLALQNPNASEL
jgi:hypothetical protein